MKKKISNKFDNVDINEYNKNITDPRKKLVVCECGRRYIYWNQYQHNLTLHHINYTRQKEGLEPKYPIKTHFCQEKTDGKPHGKWSENLSSQCPKCRQCR